MSYTVELEPPHGIVVSLQGEVPIDVVDEVIARAAELSADHPLSYSIVVLDEGVRLDFGIEELHHIARSFRFGRDRPDDYRYAFVAGESQIAPVLESYLTVVEFLTDRDIEALPPVRRFESLDTARTWARAAVKG